MFIKRKFAIDIQLKNPSRRKAEGWTKCHCFTPAPDVKQWKDIYTQ